MMIHPIWHHDYSKYSQPNRTFAGQVLFCFCRQRVSSMTVCMCIHTSTNWIIISIVRVNSLWPGDATDDIDLGLTIWPDGTKSLPEPMSSVRTSDIAGENRFFVIRAIENFMRENVKSAEHWRESWIAIHVVIVKFRFLAHEFVKNAIFNREIVMLNLCFGDLFLPHLHGNIWY